MMLMYERTNIILLQLVNELISTMWTGLSRHIGQPASQADNYFPVGLTASQAGRQQEEAKMRKGDGCLILLLLAIQPYMATCATCAESI